ncbi:MAG: hypothetical protein IPH64_16115 [Comamonadaceae bacterium]|nr:hypothetical protein [Comamonadaceae bacterium]
MAKGEQHSEKLKKKPKQDKSPTKAAGRFRPPHSAGHDRGAGAGQAEEQVSLRMSSEAALGAGGTA